MMKTTAAIATLAALAVAAAASGTPFPTLPGSFSATVSGVLAVHQGQWSPGTDGSLCCDGDAGSCKIQSEAVSQITYVDATKNRTLILPLGSNEQLYSDYVSGNAYTLQNFACQSYCPMQNDDFGPIGPEGAPTQYLGEVTVDGKKLGAWEFNTTVLGIVFERSTVYVDVTDASSPKPFNESDLLTPFGQQLGSSTTKWSNFVAGTNDAEFAKVTGIKDCKQAQNCGNNNNQLRRAANSDWESYVIYASQKNVE